MPSQISLPDTQLSRYFSERHPESATSLASLINNQPSPDALDPILTTTIKQLFLASFAQRSQIDALVSFLASSANHIQPSVSHPGHPSSHVTENQHKTAALRPSKGPELLSERLSYALYQALWDHTSRAYTPDDQSDRERPKKYYIDASVHATILARAFSTQPLFRDRLWREVEDTLIKGLFSGPEQEPGVFVALSALLLGAGVEIREYLSQEGKVGRGMDWLWWDNVRTGPDRDWGWEEIVEALNNEPGSEMLSRLPAFIKTSFQQAKSHLGGASNGLRSWGSERLANEAFAWVDES